MNNKIIVGITGASGMLYAIRLIEALLDHLMEIHLVISEMGSKVLAHELEIPRNDIQGYLNSILENKNIAPAMMVMHSPHDMFATIASGSFPAHAMAIIPCSMKTLAAVASGYSSSLLERAADVTLKERRPLILVTRETPLNRIHLKNMLYAHDAGATILPASPGFYRHPKTIEDLAGSVIGRVMDLMGFEHAGYPRWGGEPIGDDL